MGRGVRKPEGFRDLSGILILDKPYALSSNHALQNARLLYQANKAGHCGSLDPLATGVLPICFGEATKFSSYLLNSSKTYRASCKLGQTSDTGDGEGELTNVSTVNVSEADIQPVLKSLQGDIEQIPPMYSAIKHNGRRLYKLAREGVQVERVPRKITIHAISLISFKDEVLVIDVHCSKGTYIRTLAEDIGSALGCGAYLCDLHRTGVEPFLNETAFTPDQLSELAEAGLAQIDQLLLPVSAALVQFPELILLADECRDLTQGKLVFADNADAPGLHRLILQNGHFIGLGEVFADAKLVTKRLMNTST